MYRGDAAISGVLYSAHLERGSQFFFCFVFFSCVSCRMHRGQLASLMHVQRRTTPELAEASADMYRQLWQRRLDDADRALCPVRPSRTASLAACAVERSACLSCRKALASHALWRPVYVCDRLFTGSKERAGRSLIASSETRSAAAR